MPGANAEIEVVIKNYQGLHARPAAKFVGIASKYPACELTVIKDSQNINGKSVIGMMMLAAGKGTKLVLRAAGEGAHDLLRELQALIDEGFGEEM